jgi:hypothetical protein
METNIQPSTSPDTATSITEKNAEESNENVAVTTTTDDQSNDGPVTFNPGGRFHLAFASITVLAMMVSLDSTSISVALPVSIVPGFTFEAK